MQINKNINIDPSDQNSLNNYTTMSRRLTTNLKFEINSLYFENGIRPNFLICGSVVGSVLQDSPLFGDFRKTNAYYYDDKIFYIGKFESMDVYIDPSLESNTIMVRYSKKTDRDYKLGLILDEVEEDKFVSKLSLKFESNSLL